jgi:hypothetical protein
VYKVVKRHANTVLGAESFLSECAVESQDAGLQVGKKNRGAFLMVFDL